MSAFRRPAAGLAAILLAVVAASGGRAQSDDFRSSIYPVGKLKPFDSAGGLRTGQPAPDFSLPAVEGRRISLSEYLGKKNVVLSFVPAAWTPVCSEQWPGYNLAAGLFARNDVILLGITVDNIPTLYAWTKAMVPPGEKLWFPVLSDFYPHGAVATAYRVLRTDGVSERAVFVIDRKGIIRYVDVHDINERPSLDELAKALEAVNKNPDR